MVESFVGQNLDRCSRETVSRSNEHFCFLLQEVSPGRYHPTPTIRSPQLGIIHLPLLLRPAKVLTIIQPSLPNGCYYITSHFLLTVSPSAT